MSPDSNSALGVFATAVTAIGSFGAKTLWNHESKLKEHDTRFEEREKQAQERHTAVMERLTHVDTKLDRLVERL